jgi:hypothetical protein
MKRALLLLTFVPLIASAGVRRDQRPLVYLQTPIVTVANNTQIVRVVSPISGRLVDVIVYQNAAGTGGTSWTCDVVNAAAASMLSTVATVTLASGAGTKTDARGEIALPAGWTRPVIKTDSTPVVTKGATLNIHTAETGTYSPHPGAIVVLVLQPF